jgi:hypothetical protein
MINCAVSAWVSWTCNVAKSFAYTCTVDRIAMAAASAAVANKIVLKMPIAKSPSASLQA